MSDSKGLEALLGAYQSDSDADQSPVQNTVDKANHGDEEQATTPVVAPSPTNTTITTTAAVVAIEKEVVEEEEGPSQHHHHQQGIDSTPPLPSTAPDPPPTKKTDPVDVLHSLLPPEFLQSTTTTNECDPEIQARVAKWLALQQQGHHLPDTLRASREYRNPEFFSKMIENWEIDEYGSSFIDSRSLPEEDSIVQVRAEWRVEMERRNGRGEREARTKIEFARGGGGGGKGAATGTAATATATAAALAAAQAKAAALAKKIRNNTR